MVLGDSGKTVGESASRTSLDLPGHQLELLQAVYAVGKPVIVVLINGRPMSINWVNKYVPGILEAWFPGVQGWHGDRRCVVWRLQPGRQVDDDLPGRRLGKSLTIFRQNQTPNGKARRPALMERSIILAMG